MFRWLNRLFRQKTDEPKNSTYPHNAIRRTVDQNIIRQRLDKQGWKLRELPIRSGATVARWKLVAMKADKSYEVTGTTLQSALESLGKILGVIARN
jgi:hypothetical protein